FNTRFKTLEKILQSRQELQNITSINRINKKTHETISIIGMVADKHFTKNNNIILLMEDTTATIKVIITKTKPEVYNTAKDTVLDEVIGISGTTGENIIFANTIIFPDIPLINEIKKASDDAHAIILSDLHVGSIYFLEEEFNKFLAWIKCETGNQEQRELAKKVKYIFIVGDMVDGVGIYPAQEKELKIKDINQQYEAFSNFIKEIPQTIQIIISTGNHDAVRLAEPQPKIPQQLCPEIYKQANITFIGNPSMVTIHISQDFPGFDVLLYHGYSYDYYGDVVESIRNSGRHISDRNDLIMKFLLQRRHLAPTYTSTPYLPDPTQDPLVIEKIPDIFLSGHVHKAAIANYRGVQIISGSCWQSKTAFQEKVGHEPEPGRVPIINLKTRQVKMLRFDQQKTEEKA
ncbi:metallophosphoesterase, partial [Candidatus Woesearchaeota archaeon]|nr:metallophosphoesterase [Candidatus Woesearchaeota archaeon]